MTCNFCKSLRSTISSFETAGDIIASASTLAVWGSLIFRNWIGMQPSVGTTSPFTLTYVTLEVSFMGRMRCFFARSATIRVIADPVSGNESKLKILLLWDTCNGSLFHTSASDPSASCGWVTTVRTGFFSASGLFPPAARSFLCNAEKQTLARWPCFPQWSQISLSLFAKKMVPLGCASLPHPVHPPRMSARSVGRLDLLLCWGCVRVTTAMDAVFLSLARTAWDFICLSCWDTTSLIVVMSHLLSSLSFLSLMLAMKRNVVRSSFFKAFRSAISPRAINRVK